MNRFRGGSVDVRMLGPEWRHRMIDVCGVGVFKRTERRDVFVTHLDPDHLPLKEYVDGAVLNFHASPMMRCKLERLYGKLFEVFEYLDFLELKHTTFSNGRFEEKSSYAYFIGEAMIIPECDNPESLIEEYRPRFSFLLVSYQSHNHPVSFNNRRRDVFIVHNKVWKPYAPNVIPKIVFSCSNEDRELFRRFMAFGERFSNVNTNYI